MFDYEGPYYQSKLAFFRQTAGVADAVMQSIVQTIGDKESAPRCKRRFM